jgi:hypothetical protein
VLWARHVENVKEDRSNVEKFGDFFTGFDYPDEPDLVPVPSAPGFAATSQLVRY